MNTFRSAIPAALLAVAIMSPAHTGPANAQSLSGLHQKVRVGNTICMASHRHTGYAKLRSTKRRTVQAAVRDWISFTGLEYGKQWSNFRLAQKRRMDCRHSGDAWSCKVSARPCRRG
ncbi:MAG: hypothetical protein ACR2O4_00895 [Hyphomicrobiaceae bacterium]